MLGVGVVVPSIMSTGMRAWRPNIKENGEDPVVDAGVVCIAKTGKVLFPLERSIIYSRGLGWGIQYEFAPTLFEVESPTPQINDSLLTLEKINAQDRFRGEGADYHHFSFEFPTPQA